MIRVTPDFYPQFHCVASACRHSCCVGWEVDVDGETLERYRRVPGDFGLRLREQISPEETPHFLLGPEERCPFLNQENLCDIILTLGEDALCQICADHPRFRNWFPDRVEEGLGLCCEEAARLLLTHEEPIQFLSLPFDAPEEEPEELYLDLLQRRERALRRLQDRSSPLDVRVREVLSLHGLTPRNCPLEQDLDFLAGLEVLSPAWSAALESLRDGPEPEADRAWDRDGEHLMVYLVYRYYLSWGLERWDESFPLRLGTFSLRLLRAMHGAALRRKGMLTLEDRVEHLRAWSAELEYSEDNLEALAEYL